VIGGVGSPASASSSREKQPSEIRDISGIIRRMLQCSSAMQNPFGAEESEPRVQPEARRFAIRIK
jgi:hypothetical protein